jgi:hypothetical protein
MRARVVPNQSPGPSAYPDRGRGSRRIAGLRQGRERGRGSPSAAPLSFILRRIGRTLRFAQPAWRTGSSRFSPPSQHLGPLPRPGAAGRLRSFSRFVLAARRDSPAARRRSLLTAAGRAAHRACAAVRVRASALRGDIQSSRTRVRARRTAQGSMTSFDTDLSGEERHTIGTLSSPRSAGTNQRSRKPSFLSSDSHPASASSSAVCRLWRSSQKSAI